jgi:hypothetical protein
MWLPLAPLCWLITQGKRTSHCMSHFRTTVSLLFLRSPHLRARSPQLSPFFVFSSIFFSNCPPQNLERTWGCNQFQTNTSSVSQEIHRIPWNLQLHHLVYKNPPIVLTLSQINTLNVPLSYSFKVHHKCSSIYAWVFQVVSILQVSPSQPRIFEYSLP